MAKIMEIESEKVFESDSFVVFTAEYDKKKDETVVYFSNTEEILFSVDGDIDDEEIDEMFYDDYKIL